MSSDMPVVDESRLPTAAKSESDNDAKASRETLTDVSHVTTEIVELKRTLGLHNGVALIVGLIIGSGIFVSPKGVLQEIGSVGGSLIIWAVCGAITLAGALCYSELGTSVPRSGGDYAYITEALGPLPGFLFLWCAVVILMPTGCAVSSLTFAYYILQPMFPTCEPPETSVRLIAASAILLLSFINCCSVSWTNRVQYIFTIAKVSALVIIIVIGIIQLSKGEFFNFENSFANASHNPGSIALSFYSGLFSYSGCNSLNFVTEELKNPYINLPRAIWISIPLVTVIYVFANVAYFTVLSVPQLLQSNAVAVTFADKMLGVMAWCMPLFVAASTFGSLNAIIFTSARLSFVGARDGHLPAAVALINFRRFTPIPAIVMTSMISLLMLVSKNVYVLINFVCFSESVFVTLSVVSLFVLRWSRPNMYRPIKVNLVLPIFFLLIMSFVILFPLIYSATECIIALAVIASGLPVYLLLVRWNKKPRLLRRFVAKSTVFLQKLFLSVPQEKMEDETKDEAKTD